MPKETLPANAETLNAMNDALGAVVMCLAKQLTPAQRTDFANDLARLAGAAERSGRTTLEMLLIDLQNAARE